MRQNLQLRRRVILAGVVVAAMSAALLADPTTMPSMSPSMSPSTQPTTMPMETMSPGVATPATQPTTQAATLPSTQSADSPDNMMQEIQGLLQQLSPMLNEPTMIDPAARAAAAPKALALLSQIQDRLAVLNGIGGQGAMAAQQLGPQLRQFQLIFGDAAVLAAVQKEAAGTDADTARHAQSQLLLADWFKSSKDAAAQGKLLDQGEALAKAKPEDTDTTQMLVALAQISPATPELKKRAMDIAIGMNNPAATQAKMQADADAKLAAMVDKPLVISGPLVDGKPFSSDSLKSKVILVDFWATWCGPCKEELPRVKKAYADYHAKGLEVLGVSNDETADDLQKFVAADPGMPWPQLFDSAAAGKGDWNPITTGYGILGIPTMFLIDKKGVCRSVTAREDFETMIPKLLAE